MADVKYWSSNSFLVKYSLCSESTAIFSVEFKDEAEKVDEDFFRDFVGREEKEVKRED